MKNENLKDFDGIYKMHFNDIYRFVYCLIQNEEETYDMTQDAFVKLYNFLNSGREVRTPKAWIYRTAANTCYSFLNRKKKYKSILEKNFRENVFTPDIAEDTMKQQEVEMIRKSMNELPPRDRVILTLYKNGIPCREIAEIIKVKKNSVGKILARSIEKLSEIIKQGGAR